MRLTAAVHALRLRLRRAAMNLNLPELRSRNLLEPGRTCWRKERARRVAVLIDAAAYYAAFRQAALAAQHDLFIVGWDVDTRTPLVPEPDPEDGYPPTLLDFLNALL